MYGRKRLIYGFALAVALLMTASFVMRAAHRVEALRSGADEPIRPWMNALYIARSYHIPLPVVLEVLSVEPGPHAMRPIARLARDQNRPVGEVIADLRQAIIEYRRPPPPPAPTPLSPAEQP